MKTLSLKEQLKDNLRALQIEDIRQYHLTHDFYSSRKINSNYKPELAQNDYVISVEQQDLDCINELLFPEPTMGNVFADALSGLVKNPVEKLENIVAIVKPSVDLLHRVENFYRNYLEDGLLSILPEQSTRLTQQNVAVIRSAYPKNTVIMKNICILSEFWVRSPLDWVANSGVSLLEYLFVEYDAPACLKKCWYITATQENLQWLIVFILYAQGGSVKQIAANFDWTVSNNKLWHELFQVPAHLSPADAVLYCELMRMNVSAGIYKYLTENNAYVIDLLNNEDQNAVEFWYSMVRWLVQNEVEIIGTEMARILIWARHQFTEFERNGKLFSMTARSCSKVQRETLEYHREIVARRVELARREELRRLAAIARQEEDQARAEEARLEALKNSQYPFYSWEKLGLSWTIAEKGNNQWQFVELSNSEELMEEGDEMNNCVGGYSDICVEGLSAIVSLRFNNKRIATIEIDPASRTLVQAEAFANESVPATYKKLIEEWLEKLVS